MKKRISALLAFLMLASVFTACSSDTSSGNSDTQAAGNDTVQTETAAETTLEGRAGLKDNIPDDFTMNGKTVGIYSRGDNMRLYDIDGGGEETGDMVYDAVYRRTRAVEDRLDVKFNIMCIDGAWKDFGDGMEQNVLAGDDTWQIIFTTGNAAIQSSRDYLFQDLSGNKYIEVDQPWWSSEAIYEISLDGKQIKYLVGDIALYNYLKAGALYFNKNIYKDVYGNPDDLYKKVIDRDWTYEDLRKLTEGIYNDLNGDGEVNDGDMYGLLVDNVELLRHMEFSTDVREYSRDENGHPYMDYDVERAETVISTLQNLIYGTKGNGFLNEKTSRMDLFPERKTAFYVGRLEYAVLPEFRSMDDDYGIIPLPMLDENQEEYTNLIHNSSVYTTIPMTCVNPDEIGAVIEALCSESHRSVIEVFYETALKTKYSRDSYSGQCIDIIREVSAKRFLYEYNGVVKGGTLITDQVKNNTSTFASVYASQVDATNINIKNLIEKYSDLNG